MRWRGSIFVTAAIVALAGCGHGGSEAPAVPADAGREAPAPLTAAEPVRLSLEIVEGETVAVPVSYVSSRPVFGQGATIGLEASYGTASPEDILLMERTTVPLDGSDEEATVELGLRALRDGTMEGAETLFLRPVKWDDHPDHAIRLRDAEIEVVIGDEPYPCSEVEVRVDESPKVLVDRFDIRIYASEIEVVAPASESVIKWIEPADDRVERVKDAFLHYQRTRSLNAWRIESLGDRVHHRMTAQWWGGPLSTFLRSTRFDLQVCGGPGYGKFVRCSTTECAVHEEGL